jgi:prevent-host-death family protein
MGKLVSVTRIRKQRQTARRTRERSHSGYWPLQDAKARFSELVRKVRSDGPQHVTVHGKEEVVVIAAEEFSRLRGSVTGRALVEALQSSPRRETNIEPARIPGTVRDVVL